MIFPSLPANPQLADVFKRFPHPAPPLLDFHDRLLRDPSPLTVAERELIAAYVSALNACNFCLGAHEIAARAHGVDPDRLEALLADPAAAAVDGRLKPILAYVRKLTLTPARITEADAAAVYDAGWDEQALFDAVIVCALFNMMNRIVEGAGVKRDPRLDPPEEVEARLKRMGAPGPDPHRSEHTYSRLAGAWGLDQSAPDMGSD